MENKYQLFIDGKYSDSQSGETFDVICPGNNEVLAQVPRGSAEDVDRAVQSAGRAFRDPTWRDMDLKRRVEVLQRIGELILERLAEVARLEALDTGNPIRDVKNYYIPGAAGCFQFYPPLAYHLAGEQIPISPQRFDYTLYEPLGVVAVIVPWNDPLEIAASRLAAALAAGNTCVLKPSPLAPLSCLRLGELLEEAGLPPGVVNIVAGLDEEVGTPLINHPSVNMISFTGSVKTGQIIQSAAARTTKRLSLEMGGKSANIVLPDADLSKAVPGAAQAVYSMSGQNCVAGTRLFLHEQVYDDFLEGLVQVSNGYRVGEILDPETMMGPLISQTQLAKVEQYVANGQQQGAKLILGGRRLCEGNLARGNYFPPTIFVDVRPEMKISQEEIFGPVVAVFRFSSLEEMVRLANDTYYGLGAGIWTENLSQAHRLARLLESGTVYINTYNEFYYQAPFAGYKRSGLGSEYGLDALKPYVQRKNVIVRLD